MLLFVGNTRLMSNSDYTKPRTDLFTLLPNVLRTKVNKALLENVYNRYLTKTELVPAVGSIGKRSPSMVSDTRLPEPTVHRQAWQLQPLMYSKIATAEYITSYYDVLSEAARLGIDASRLPKWGNALQFNFAPPINIDKLINYSDYYWYDETGGDATPQYITIRNECAVANNRYIQLEAQLAAVTSNPISTQADIDNMQQLVNDAIVQRDCVCSGGGIGWDRTGWDDSGGDWWLNLPTAPTNTPPSASAGDTFVYYDTGTTTVKVWSTTALDWVDAATPHGTYPWDTSDSCNTQTNQWTTQNKWVHKSALNNSLGGLARRAEMPIIEYDSDIELNQWVYVSHTWQYRANDVSGWQAVTSVPSDLELSTRYDILTVDYINNEIYIAGDLTSLFVSGFMFATENATTYENSLWTVDISGFDGTNTVIKIAEPIGTSTILVGYKVIPTATTSLGDTWKGFFYHWLYVGASQPVPVNNQVENTAVVFNETLSTVGNSTLFSAPSPFLVGGNIIRVYVDGIRQYGNYVEGWDNGSSFTTVLPDGIHGNAIQFFNSVTISSTVRIETNPAALSDVNHNEVLVRTSVGTFPATNQPTTVTLTNYLKVEQVKTETNQYPIFDIFNVDGTTTYRANSIFVFQESPTSPIDPRVNKRIITTNSRKEFYFDQQLLDTDNGKLYCYKSGKSIEPTNPAGLQTIWRKGTNNEEYVPRYVNQYRLADGDPYLDPTLTPQTTHINPGVSSDYSTSGDWEIANQLYYNVNHENRKLFRLTDLVAHFNTIIAAQTPDVTMSFLQNQSTIVGTLEQYNMGVGGSIKEFNDSFDMFLSAMYQDSNDPMSLITFAKTQYDNNITYLQQLFVRNAADYLAKGTNINEVAYIWNQGAAIADDIITLFELNEAFNVAFGDSTTYDPTNTQDAQGNKIGIQNWIATLPFLKLAVAVEPQALFDVGLGIRKIRHHDGHITDITIDSRTKANVIAQVMQATNGSTGTILPTSGLTQGAYWKNITTGKLYRYNVVSVSSSPPGIINPVGSMWLNSATNSLYVRDTSPSGWSLHVGPITDAWKEVDVENVVMGIILEAEQRLYRAVPAFSTFSFDYNILIPTSDATEQEVFVEYLTQSYFDFIQQYQLNPFVTDFNATNAFTWNYGGIDPNDISLPTINYPTTVAQTNKPWGARWTTIYQSIYGTSYPHLEPWVLQGYTNKPDWWDTEYKDMSGTRRWIPTMWTNVSNGVIPVGRTPPVGTIPTYSHFCVNIYDTSIVPASAGYGVDELLPPYYVGNAMLQQQSLLNTSSWLGKLTIKTNPTDIINSSEYSFGDIGPVEQLWRESVEFLYDIVKVAFRMQPVRFLHYAMGFEFYDVAGLQVEKMSNKVLSHKDMIFHGDLSNGSIYKSGGLSQWYTNFIRYGAYDMNKSSFKAKWTTWNPVLSYQTASFINAKSLQLGSKYFPITKQDYNVTTKKTPGFADYWLDSLFVTTHQVGSWKTFNNTKIPNSAGHDWQFRVEIASPVGRDIHYYNVMRYKFTVDVSTNICTSSVGLPWDVPMDGWTTGTAVYISADGLTPAGVNSERVYFIIKVANNQFQLANSLTEAQVGLAINLTTSGVGDIFVGGVKQTFVATDGNITNHIWSHFNVDKRTVNTIQTPYVVTGVQNLINFIDGYVEYYKDQGFIFNDPDSQETEIDLETGKPLSWQVEIERLINRIYTGLGNVQQVVSYEQPGSGEYTAGVGSDWLTRRNNISQYHEVNPFRNNVWFNNKIGIVSDIISGPFDVVSGIPLIYDSNGVGTTSDKLFIYREDSKSQISLCSLSGSVYDGKNTSPRPYNDTHISGVHLFVDTFEHIIMFNDYTIDNNLLYDSYIGLNTNKLTVEFEKHIQPTYRPNVGGYFVNNNELDQNIEYSISNMKNYYDTYVVNETADYLSYARAVLGYEDPVYLNNINVGAKSKFIFWRGMLQYKGSVNSINAFINSKLFVDAKLDEFWTYKIAEYGNVDATFYPEVVLKVGDIFKNELRLHFTSTNETTQQTFTPITFEDNTRWVNLPELRSFLTEYRTMRYDWTLPVWDTQLVNNSSDLDNLFFDAEYSEQIKITPTNQYIRLPNSCDGISIISDHNNTIIKLVDGVDYIRVNSYVIQLLAPDLSTLGELTIYTINPAKQIQNPAKLVDIKSRTVLSNLPLWDPIRGHQYTNAYNIVDSAKPNDAAIYGVSLDDNIDATHCWNSKQVGMVWLDTNDMQYVPYNDTIIFPQSNDRTSLWGKLADWYDLTLYEWTESDVDPIAWDALVTSQSTDVTIPQNKKVTGTPRKVLYKQTRPTINDNWSSWSIVSNPSMDVYGYNYSSLNYVLSSNSGTAFAGTNGSLVDVYLNGLYKGQTRVYNIIDTTLTTPPTTPAIGDLYVVAVGGTGAWLGLDGQLVEWNGANWVVNNTPIQLTSSIAQIYIGTLIPTVNNWDTVRVIESLQLPLEETSVGVLSSSTDLLQYMYNTPYSTVSTVDNVGNVVSTKYYFWVKQKTNITNGRVYSLQQATSQIINPGVAYLFYQNFIPANTTLPAHYSQVIVRGVSNRITDDDRYVIRFTKDHSMRDEESISNSNFSKKNVHKEWVMFRKEQEARVPRLLWNKVTETVTGHPLVEIDSTHYTVDTTILIPSLDRVHFDTLNNTVTRFGLGPNQAFSDKTMTINTIISEIQNPDFDLYPISREAFFATHSFDTTDNIKAAMDYIYDSFPIAAVNRILFSVLHDALSLKAEYADLFKTSAIALHGVRLFETADRVIDD